MRLILELDTRARGGVDPPENPARPRLSFEELSLDLGSTRGNVTEVTAFLDLVALKSVLYSSFGLTGHRGTPKRKYFELRDQINPWVDRYGN